MMIYHGKIVKSNFENHLILFRYEKNRANENIIKTAEFRSAKKIEEEALMAALGLKIMPPPG